MNRILPIDIIRILSVILIIVSHTCNSLIEKKITFPFIFFLKDYTSGLGSSLFIIMSGFLLTYIYKKNQFSLKLFYIKRYTTLLAPYIISYFFMSSIFLILKQCFYLNTYTSFEKIIYGTQIPISYKEYLSTLLGLDGFLIDSNISTNTIFVVGEWFIGFIVLIFAVYPILRFFINKYPLYTFLTSLILALIYPLFFSKGVYIFPIIHHFLDRNPIMRLPEFIFGAIFFQVLAKLGEKFIFTISLIIISLYVFFCSLFHINYNDYFFIFQISVSFSLFSIIYISCNNINYNNYYIINISYLSNYAYITMLVQHMVINGYIFNLNVEIWTKKGIIFLFILIMISSFLLARFIKPFSNALVEFILNISIRTKK